MRKTPEDRPPRPLLTASGVATLMAVVLAGALLAYVLAMGGVQKAARALGFGPDHGPLDFASGPGPIQVCSADLGVLRTAAVGALRALGELPSDGALREAEGIPQIDPWGQPYRVHRGVGPDGRPQMWFTSDGPDGQPGTTDDLNSGTAP